MSGTTHLTQSETSTPMRTGNDVARHTSPSADDSVPVAETADAAAIPLPSAYAPLPSSLGVTYSLI
jgi:hypothetical protein